MPMKQPRLSVVTVTYNAESCVEKTILSVLNQTYANVEYLIIDGGSKDGTMDIVNRYKDRIHYIVSEKDRGIFDGMNKGIFAAQGDYVIMMNADDTFHDNKVLEDVAAFIAEHPDSDVVFGNANEEREYGFFVTKPDLASISKKMSISHQALFVKTDLLKQKPFVVEHRYAADFEQVSAFYLEGRPFSYIDRTIADIVLSDGTTFNNHIASVNELYDIREARGENIRKERRSMICRKRTVRFMKTCLPSFVSKPLFCLVAKFYKTL